MYFKFSAPWGPGASKKLNYSCKNIFLIYGVWVLAALASLNARAEEIEAVLSAEPERCVALHRGQKCYQKIIFSWTAPKPGEYCLKLQGEEAPIECWKGKMQGSIPVVFESAQDLVYQIIDLKDDRRLALVTIKVAWVYKSNRRRSASWRLF